MSAIEPQLDLDDFRAVMSMWPSGVTITTTIDDDGLRWGFTASAFSSLSLEPPLILVCVRAAAKSHDTFRSCEGIRRESLEYSTELCPSPCSFHRRLPMLPGARAER